MRKCLFCLSALLVAIASYAQPDLPPVCNAWLPKILDNDVISKKDAQSVLKGDYGQSPVPNNKNYWVVFSDRDNNTVYSTSSGKNPCGSLNFNERVIISG